MFKVFDKFEKTNFNDFTFITILTDNGFDVHNVGGTDDNDFANGEVFRFENGQYQLTGSENAILTCSPNMFFETLTNVEKQFNYRLFG